ncbi:MAG: hypothetical protein D6819_08710 [Gammaproteobacteria bacterium]|nr:MAG: hypothetical protein D6819_08710 [Gammaproteobacteria bacterium]
MPNVFEFKDCALIPIAIGKKALTLKEFWDHLLWVDANSIYNHFWGALLQPRFEEREYNNDFAAWARHGLHDAKLAERLAVIDPTDYPDLEGLRQKVIEVVEERLDESEYLQWVRATQPFEFLRSQIVVFDTHLRIASPEELANVIPHLSPSSIFYHFIDARRRLEDGGDDFRFWLGSFGERYGDLCVRLSGIDPYFGSLLELRQQLAELFGQYFGGGHA